MSVTGGVDVSGVVHSYIDNKLVVTFSLNAGQTVSGNVVTVELLSSNADSKVLTDVNGNAADAFSQSVYVN
ncbi:hypothetical protein D3C76_1715370 [compost metagenome]